MAFSFSRTIRTSGPEDMKVAKPVEERLAGVDGIKALGLLLGDGLLLDGDDLKAGLVDLGQNGSGEAFADRVRLDDAEGALRHVVLLLEGIFVCLSIVIAARCGAGPHAGANLLKFRHVPLRRCTLSLSRLLSFAAGSWLLPAACQTAAPAARTRRRARAARLRSLADRQDRGPLRELLPLQLQRLVQAQSAARRPDLLWPLYRACRAEPAAPEADSRRGAPRRSRTTRSRQRAEDRRRVRELHGHGRDQQAGPCAAAAGAGPHRRAQDVGGAARAAGAPARHRRECVLRHGIEPGLCRFEPR